MSYQEKVAIVAEVFGMSVDDYEENVIDPITWSMLDGVDDPEKIKKIALQRKQEASQ